jgi:hypothetical protein
MFDTTMPPDIVERVNSICQRLDYTLHFTEAERLWRIGLVADEVCFHGAFAAGLYNSFAFTHDSL